MSLVSQIPSVMRRLVHLWVTVWITTVPLFHIHLPDSTDSWSALQSGGAHTVFSPDLPGEFSVPFVSSHQQRSCSLSKRAVNSPEMSISVFNEKSEDRRVKHQTLHAFLHVTPA